MRIPILSELYDGMHESITILFYTKDPCKECIVRPACTMECPKKEELMESISPDSLKDAKVFSVINLFVCIMVPVGTVVYIYAIISTIAKG